MTKRRSIRRFVEETSWPEFQELADTLTAYLTEVTERVVAAALHGDSSDAAEVSEPDRRE